MTSIDKHKEDKYVDDHNMGAVDLPKKTKKSTQLFRRVINTISQKPMFIFAAVFALIGISSLVFTLALSNNLSGKISQKNPSGSHSISVADTGELSVTVFDSGSRRSDVVRFKLSLLDAQSTPVVSYAATKPGEPVTLTHSVEPGQFTILVESLDSLSKRGTNYTLDVSYPDNSEVQELDSQLPSISISQPKNSNQVSGTFSLVGNASDNVSVAAVYYRFENGSYQTATGTTDWVGSLDSTTQSNGEAIIEVKAVDTSGNETIQTVTVTIYNSPVVSDEPQTSGIWLSKEEIMKLPTSGAAYDRVRSAGDGVSGSPADYVNDTKHDTDTLALAMLAVRLEDNNRIQKVVTELKKVTTVDLNQIPSALRLARDIQAYVLAADIIDLKTVDPAFDQEFRNYLSTALTVDIRGHSCDGLLGTAKCSSNNWGTHARAAVSIIALYLGDQELTDNSVQWFKGFLGDKTAYDGFKYQDTEWHADLSDRRPINAVGTTKNGISVDGVLPEDQRRCECDPPVLAEENYVYEALQGTIVTNIVLARQGLIDYEYEDAAIRRAITWLYEVNKFAAVGDDTWQPYLYNKYFGMSVPTGEARAGKNMGWTDWTHN